MPNFGQTSLKAHCRQTMGFNAQLSIALAYELLKCLFVKVYRCIASNSSTGFSRMKLGFALFLSLFCLTIKSTAADFVVSNNAVFVLFGDSYDQDQYGS